MPFIDLDDVILKITDQRHPGHLFDSCRTVYKTLGKAAFRRLEAEAAADIAAGTGESPAVCALGGGTLENNDARRHLEGTGLFLYLQESPDILYNRILSGGLPPFLSPGNPRDDFDRLYTRREKIYMEAADITVHAGGRTKQEVCREALERIKEAGYGG